MPFLRPNLDIKGRIIRAIGALAMAVAAILTWPHSRTAGIVLAGSALFVAFEAARGWCALRACGVKTKF
jgi:tryptophan-rich sensory protein